MMLGALPPPGFPGEKDPCQHVTAIPSLGPAGFSPLTHFFPLSQCLATSQKGTRNSPREDEGSLAARPENSLLSDLSYTYFLSLSLSFLPSKLAASSERLSKRLCQGVGGIMNGAFLVLLAAFPACCLCTVDY